MAAELCALSEGCKVAVYLRALLAEFGFPERQPTRLLCDNLSAVRVALNPHCFTSKVRHIRARLQWLRQMVADEEVTIHHVPSGKNISDMQTKCLGSTLHKRLMPQVLGHVEPEAFEELDDFESNVKDDGAA